MIGLVAWIVRKITQVSETRQRMTNSKISIVNKFEISADDFSSGESSKS